MPNAIPPPAGPDWWNQFTILGVVYSVCLVVSCCEQMARNHRQAKFPLFLKANISGWIAVAFSSLVFDRIGDSLVRLILAPILIGLAGSRGSKIFLEIARMAVLQKFGLPLVDLDAESDPAPKPRARKHPKEVDP